MSLEILAYEETPLGLLCLRRRELLSNPGTLVTEVTLNHEFLMSSYLTVSERELTRLGLQRVSPAHGSSGTTCKVLVGGLGLGYSAAEALKSQTVTSVEVVEFLPQVIGWMADGLVPLSETINQDDRVTVSRGDIYDRVTQPEPAVDGRFDLIVIDVDHSPQDVLGEQSYGFYTAAGLKKTIAHLNPNGVLGVWSYAEDTPLLTQMSQVFTEVEVEQITVWNDLINEEQTDWLFYGRRSCD